MAERIVRTDRLRRGILASFSVPPAVLMHEFGHWIGYVLAGLPEPTIQYASSGFCHQPAFWNAIRAGDLALAETMGSVTGAGIAAFLGIGVSWSLMLGGAWLVRRGTVMVVAAAIVLASAVRFVPVGLFLVRGAAEHTDESHVAQAVGWPPLLPVLNLLGITLATLSILKVARSIPAGDRRPLLSDLVTGVIARTVAWMGFIGPVVLP